MTTYRNAPRAEYYRFNIYMQRLQNTKKVRLPPGLYFIQELFEQCAVLHERITSAYGYPYC